MFTVGLTSLTLLGEFISQYSTLGSFALLSVYHDVIIIKSPDFSIKFNRTPFGEELRNVPKDMGIKEEIRIIKIKKLAINLGIIFGFNLSFSFLIIFSSIIFTHQNILCGKTALRKSVF